MKVGSRPVPDRVGDHMIVAYDPQDPESVEISGSSALRPAMFVAFIVGGLRLIFFV